MLFSGFISSQRMVTSHDEAYIYLSDWPSSIRQAARNHHCRDGGMLYSVLQPYLTDFVSVLKLVEGLDDPDDVYKRKVNKGAHCADISSVPLSNSDALALDKRLNRIPPVPLPSVTIQEWWHFHIRPSGRACVPHISVLSSLHPVSARSSRTVIVRT